jgi:hypothetical protein
LGSLIAAMQRDDEWCHVWQSLGNMNDHPQVARILSELRRFPQR